MQQSLSVKARILEQTDGIWRDSLNVPYDDFRRRALQTRNCMIVFLDCKELWKAASLPLQRQFHQDFGVPPSFFSILCQESNGFFHSEDSDSSQDGGSYTSTFRFQVKHVQQPPKVGKQTIVFRWAKHDFVLRWRRDRGVVLIVFDATSQIQSFIPGALEERQWQQFDTTSPFDVQLLILEAMTYDFDEAVWSVRHLIRAMENTRPTIENPKVDYAHMHETLRHAVHSSEMLNCALDIVDSMVQDFNQSWSHLPDATNIVKKFRYYNTTFKGLLHRSRTLETRLKDEINLAFNVNAQYESKLSAKIAAATQRDSTMMKTISILGLLFLPGTFIAAIFSMSFFNYNPETGIWQVSNRFWIYWVVTIPITALFLTVWSRWFRREHAKGAVSSPSPDRPVPTLPAKDTAPKLGAWAKPPPPKKASAGVHQESGESGAWAKTV